MKEKQEYQNPRIGSHLRFLDSLILDIRRHTMELKKLNATTGDSKDDI